MNCTEETESVQFHDLIMYFELIKADGRYSWQIALYSIAAEFCESRIKFGKLLHQNELEGFRKEFAASEETNKMSFLLKAKHLLLSACNICRRQKPFNYHIKGKIEC